MLRQAFVLRLKPSMLSAYVQHHNQMWPELVEEIRASGIERITMVADDPLLYLFSDVATPDAWDRLWHSDVHMRWAQAMSPYLEIRPDGIVDSRPLHEVFHLES
ncbi:MAG TPA: L-rhamnose mutarotase [Chloroflexota bacterium]|nr:L-rhamnose mutarotase [Chloroflexota bacterium]